MREKARIPLDRRTGVDRRAIYTKKFFPFKGQEKRGGIERRVHKEKRQDWDRVTLWSSSPIPYLQDPEWYLNRGR